MHSLADNHQKTRRLQYLQAMGITAWQQRPTTQTVNDLTQVLDVLIWVQADAQQQWTNILQDLQALCLYAQSNSTNKPRIITSQPGKIPSTTYVLAIGLPAQQQAWLADNTNHLTTLPAIDDWANDIIAKRNVWVTIQEALWLL